MSEKIGFGKNGKVTTSRRKALAGIATAGVGLIGSQHITGKVSALPSSHVSIVQGTKLVRQNNGNFSKVKIRKEVPKDWYQNLQNAKKVYAAHQHTLQSLPGVIETTLSAGRYGGRDAVIRVTISSTRAQESGTSVSEVRGELPEMINDVPVHLKITDTVPQTGGYYDDNSDPAEVGTQVATPYLTGTLGGRALKDNDWHFMTCEHLWTETNPGTLYVEHTDSTKIPIGDAQEWDCYDDFAALTPVNGWTTSDAIINSDNRISAQMSEDGIWDLEANYEAVYKKGWKTGYTGGVVKGIGSAIVYNNGCNNRDKQVKWGDATYDFGDGDSGSLVYKPNYNGEDWAVSLAAAQSDNVFGTGCFHIENLHGYHWG